FTVENWPMYVLSIAVGTVIVAGLVIVLRGNPVIEDDEFEDDEYKSNKSFFQYRCCKYTKGFRDSNKKDMFRSN
ncbi:hypothetical protein ACTPEF_24590, partial [Clostridioides difficile]